MLWQSCGWHPRSKQQYSYGVHTGNKNVVAISPKPWPAAGFAGYDDHMIVCCLEERQQQLSWATTCGTFYMLQVTKERDKLNHFQSPATASWWDTRPPFRNVCSRWKKYIIMCERTNIYPIVSTGNSCRVNIQTHGAMIDVQHMKFSSAQCCDNVECTSWW
jgi:hypothetical protein